MDQAHRLVAQPCIGNFEFHGLVVEDLGDERPWKMPVDPVQGGSGSMPRLVTPRHAAKNHAING